jgi:hypothetical protein
LRKEKTKFILFLSLSFLFISKESFALRCGNRLVSEGESVSKVLLKCGAPTLKNQWQKEVVQKSIIQNDSLEVLEKTYINYEEWIYDFGPDQFVQSLTFENNSLISIRSIGYGGYPYSTLSAYPSNAPSFNDYATYTQNQNGE